MRRNMQVILRNVPSYFYIPCTTSLCVHLILPCMFPYATLYGAPGEECADCKDGASGESGHTTMCPRTNIHVPSHYYIPHTTMCPHTIYIALQVRIAITERMEHLERQVLILLCVHILIYTAYDNIRALIILNTSYYIILYLK